MLLIPKTNTDEINLIGHCIVNYPCAEDVRNMVSVMVESGVKLIELQIPFSEPSADGPLFMHANHEALAHGVHVSDAFELMREVTHRHPDTHFVFMTYVNVIYQMGFEQFVLKAKKVGAKGAIVPDLPFEYASEYLQACKDHDFAAITLVPINISDERMQAVCQHASGFIYAVPRVGVTGNHTNFNAQVVAFLKRIRAVSELPIAVGFGIRTKADIEFLKPHADAAIIGSHALKIFQQNGLPALRTFWQSLVND